MNAYVIVYLAGLLIGFGLGWGLGLARRRSLEAHLRVVRAVADSAVEQARTAVHALLSDRRMAALIDLQKADQARSRREMH